MSLGRLLAAAPTRGWRVLAIIVSDGLSAQAAERHAAPVIVPLIELLTARDWTVFPMFIVPFARVKLQDEIGEILDARHTLLTCEPGAARTDADRNRVSNIRPERLAPAADARNLAHLLVGSARLGKSGVVLKDTEPAGELTG